MNKVATLPIVLLSVMVLGACGGDEEDDENNSNGGFVAITNTQSANLVAGAIGDTTAVLVPSGTYNNTVISGSSGGTATVSGTESFSTGSCGSSCVTSSNSANLTITFNNFFVRPGSSTNTRLRITGTVTFTDNRSSTQSGLNFSSSGQMRVTATSPLTVLLEIVDSTGTYGYTDTLSALSTFGTGTTWDGTLRPSNGVTYSF